MLYYTKPDSHIADICYYHGVSSHAYFDGFQIVAVSFISEASFPFCCFVFDMNQLKVKFADQ